MLSSKLLLSGDFSSGFNKSVHLKYAYMMAVEEDDNIFNSLFTLMTISGNDEEVTIFDINQGLNDYSLKTLKSLENMLINYLWEFTKENISLVRV